MKCSLESWFTRWLGRKNHAARNARKLAACVTLTLATAWAAPSVAVGGFLEEPDEPDPTGTTVRLSVSPTETLTNVMLGYYTKNTCSGQYKLFASLPGGTTSTLEFLVPGTTLADFDENIPGSFATVGYMLVGLHGEGGSQSVAISFPPGVLPPAPVDDEGTPIDLYADLREALITENYFGFFGVSDFIYDVKEEQLAFFGTEATIYNFSDPTFGGTLRLVPLPEPATWVLVVTAAGGGVMLGLLHGRMGLCLRSPSA